MKKYICTKTVHAEPMKYGEAYKEGLIRENAYVSEYDDNDGYMVEYEDGYKSWSPAEVFDSAYKIAETPVDRINIEQKDITERIKTFEDACEWCTENGHHNIRREYDCIVTDTLILDEVSPDLIAYLKLRIITCALNEGWEPTFEKGEERYEPHWATDEELSIYLSASNARNYPIRLSFKTREICKYAATLFRDIYMDFFYKGKE